MYLDTVIELLTSNIVYLLIAIIIGIMIVITILKKVFRLFLVSVLVLVLYVVYLAWSGQKIPMTTEEIIRHGSEQVEKLKPRSPGKTGVDSLMDLKNLTEKGK